MMNGFTKVKSLNGYDYYKNDELFNIVPLGNKPPNGGYKKAAYILAIKGIARVTNEIEAKKIFE